MPTLEGWQTNIYLMKLTIYLFIYLYIYCCWDQLDLSCLYTGKLCFNVCCVQRNESLQYANCSYFFPMSQKTAKIKCELMFTTVLILQCEKHEGNLTFVLVWCINVRKIISSYNSVAKSYYDYVLIQHVFKWIKLHLLKESEFKEVVGVDRRQIMSRADKSQTWIQPQSPVWV